MFTNKINISIPASDRIEIPYSFRLSSIAHGYLLETFFTEEGKRTSRRYIKVGNKDRYRFYDLPIEADDNIYHSFK